MFLPSTSPKLIILISCEDVSWVITTDRIAVNRGVGFFCHLEICFHKTSGNKVAGKRGNLFSHSPVSELLSGTLANSKGLDFR